MMTSLSTLFHPPAGRFRRAVARVGASPDAGRDPRLKNFRTYCVALLLVLFLAPSLSGQNNPIPFVHQPLVPTAVAPGGPDFTLTVNGAGFVPESVIQWNSNPRPTTFISSTQLTAAIPASDIATIGSASITVFNPAPGGGVSNAALLLITFPIPSVRFTQTDFGTTGGVFAVATADFNSDGNADLAALRDYEVLVFPGNGDGTFQPQRSFPTGGYSGHPFLAGIVAADFNRDGKIDLAVTNFHSMANPDLGTFSILLGNGDATFQVATDYTVGDAGPSDVACGDFNGDGNLDIAVVGRHSEIGKVAIFVGAGDGTFTFGNEYSAVKDYPYGLAIGDFNGDDLLDLVIPAFYGDYELSVLLGNGDGTFQQGPKSLGAGGVSVAAADFDGDGKLDVATGSYFDTSVGHALMKISLGIGNGGFHPVQVYGTGHVVGAPYNLIVADLNGDRWLDLAAPEGPIAALLGNGDGTFQADAIFFPAPASALSLLAADLDTDGRIDLATGKYYSPALTIFMQQSPVDLEPGALRFGDQRLGTPSSSGTATLANNLTGPLIISSIAVTGADAADFIETNDCPLAPATLAAGASCTISVTFDHSTLGAKEASVVINDDALGYPQQVLNLTGTIVDPAVTLSTTSFDFGDQPVDVTSAARTVTMTNSGVGNLTITGITTTGDFAATNNCGSTLAQGAQCTISITFNPQEAGIFFGTVTVTSNAADSPQIITLKGTGTPPTLTLSPLSLTFGDQLVHTTSPPQTVTLTNNGPGPLRVGSTSQTNEFGVTTDCLGTVAVSASCTISVTFHPEFNGTRTGTATIFDNAAGTPHTISLTGTGLGPVAELSPASLNFPNQPMGTSSPPQTVTLTNTGGAVMALSGIFATGPFEKTTTCTAILSSGANCTITVVFTPASTGAAQGSLTVNSDAPGSTPTVELTGNGMDLQLTLPAGGSNSATVTAGGTATYNLVLDPKGFVGNATIVCAWNGPQPVGASCSASPNPVALNGTDPAPVTISVTTTARSTAAPPFGGQRSPPQPNPWARHAAPLMAALLALMLAMGGRRVAPPFRAAFAGLDHGVSWAPPAVILMMVLLWASCGGDVTAPLTPKPPGTPAGNYTMTVTVTAGEVTRATVLGLSVN